VTTLADIQAGSLGFRWVLLIEGCELALCNFPDPSDVSDMLTAASWDWTDAVNGLCVLGGWEQELRPWDPSVQVGRLSFSVQKGIRASTGGESDAFAELVFGAGAGVETYLTAALDCNDTTVTVKSTSGYGASGHVHIGTEAIGYTGKTATTFTGCVRGKYAPFKANTEASQRFGQPHRIPNVGDDIIIQPKVTSVQREWRGRRVGLWMVSYGTTSWSDAQLVWAGRIENTRDGSNGLTYLECVDIKAQLKECELLRHQFEGRIREGVYLFGSWRFEALDDKAGTVKTANDLVVVSSGAAGSNEINAGLYSIEELIDALNAWLSSEYAAARLNHKWYFSLGSNAEGPRSAIHLSSGSSAGINRSRIAMQSIVCEFLGFTADGHGPSTFGWAPNNVGIAIDWDQSTSTIAESPEEPYRHIVTPNQPYRITVEDIRGTRFDNRPFLPNLDVTLDSGAEWAVLQVGGESGPMALYRLISETADEVVFSGGTPTSRLDDIAGTRWGFTRTDKIRYSEGVDLTVRQVALIGGRMDYLFTRILASTGTSGYNHASFDSYPQQLGAGLPWELLGNDWLNTIGALNSQLAWITLVITKPTKLMSRLGVELVARVAQIIWKDEGLRVVSWGTPTAARALHAFTEANKRTQSDAKDAQRAPAVSSDEFLVNRVRLLYGRGERAGDVKIVDPASQDTHGQFSKEVTVESLAGQSSAYDLIEQLKLMVPFFSRPMHVLTRSIGPEHYENCAPGDFCTVSDNFARDPSTGTRGLSSKPGLIIKHGIDWGGFDDTGKSRTPNGTIDILLLPLSNIATYSPCAEVDNTAGGGGYNAGTKVLTLKAHEHTEASETADAAWFLIGENVRVVEIDPATAAAPLTWTDVVAAQSGNTITLTTGLAGWDATKRYRVISDVYSASDATQTTDVYQADDADARIEDLAGAYVYGTDLTQAGTWTDDDGDELVALYSEYAYGDGRPLDTGYEKDIARLVNNLVNYRTQVICPRLTRSVMNHAAFTGSSTKAIIAVFPINLHPGALMLGERYLYVRPWLRSTDGTSASMTVSLCAKLPRGTSLENGDPDAPEYELGAPYESHTWTTSSTTYAAGAEFGFSGKTADSVTGKAYLVIEVSSTKLETRGLAEVWQGPFVEAA
jgi:hypothetical protein